MAQWIANELSRQERLQIDELLSGGVQPMRTVIRALMLRQMDEGRSTVEVGAGLGISAEVVWEIGKRYLEGGLERVLYDTPRPGQKPLLDAEHGQRIILMVLRPAASRAGAEDGATDRSGGGPAQVGRACGTRNRPHPASVPRAEAVAEKNVMCGGTG